MSIFLAHNHKMLKSAGRYVGWVKNNLPPLGANSIRIKWKKGETPKNFGSGDYLNSLNIAVDSIECVDPLDNIYDVTYSGTDWTSMFIAGGNMDSDRLIEILDGNLQNVTKLRFLCGDQTSLKSVWNLNTSDNLTVCYDMFVNCSSLTQVPLFDTSNVEEFLLMFKGCSSLTSVPAFDTSRGTNFQSMFEDCVNLLTIPQIATGSATDVRYIFKNCYRASTGILSIYNQMSSQSIPPSLHTEAFKDCGRDSVTGAAELAQIPSDWK